MWCHDCHHLMLQNDRIVIDKPVEVAVSGIPTLCYVILAFYEVSG